MGRTQRKLEVFTFHAHLPGDEEVDYRRLFMDLRGLSAGQRQERTRDRQIAIPSVRVVKSGAAILQAYEGEPEVAPLIYDTAAGTERYADTTSTEIVATKTHARFEFSSREAIIEYNHRGAKAPDIADVVAGSLVRHNERWAGLSFELAPHVDASFVESIDAFERIRQVKVRLTEPNYDWTDSELRRTSVGAGHARAIALERTCKSYTRMLWTGLKREAAYLPG